MSLDPGRMNMSETVTLVGPTVLNSIVLGAAQDEAHRLGFTIAAPAQDFLLTKSLPALNKANEDGTLAAKRAKIESNTVDLVRFIVKENFGPSVTVREITYEHLVGGLSVFCEHFPDWQPFCP
jgi:hypothetical protein